jgi:hypothetical protein
MCHCLQGTNLLIDGRSTTFDRRTCCPTSLFMYSHAITLGQSPWWSRRSTNITMAFPNPSELPPSEAPRSCTRHPKCSMRAVHALMRWQHLQPCFSHMHASTHTSHTHASHFSLFTRNTCYSSYTRLTRVNPLHIN